MKGVIVAGVIAVVFYLVLPVYLILSGYTMQKWEEFDETGVVTEINYTHDIVHGQEVGWAVETAEFLCAEKNTVHTWFGFGDDGPLPSGLVVGDRIRFTVRRRRLKSTPFFGFGVYKEGTVLYHTNIQIIGRRP